jgi:NADH-quinone oxidoreductase subunit L
LLDGWLHAPVVFWVLALAALLTAFYTTRQIIMTFFGEARTAAAAHAHETAWTMTTPLIILSFFAIVAGWINIPPDFPLFGPIASAFHVDFWFKHMVGGALIEAPAANEFNIVPFSTSLIVALGGILLGWLVYRNAYKKADDRDPMMFLGPVYTFLQKKYMVDEFYHFVFVRSSQWISETLTYKWIDKGVIDGILHTIGRVAYFLGHIFKDDVEKYAIDEPPIKLAEATQWLGKSFRVIQTGRIQNYLIVGVLSALLFGLVYYLRVTGVLP